MSSSYTEPVLVVESTGNIGVAAVKVALNSKRNVLAIVRNQASADKLIRHVGSSQGITFAEIDISSDMGAQRVVEKGKTAFFPVPGMTQGALFTMSTGAAHENEKTNVRFNEVYLCFRVEVDEQAEKHGVTCASEFAKVYENLLGDEEVRGARVTVREVVDIGRLVWQRKV
ncbi:unnamed protein product [Alternaria sp. RS040]